MENDVIFLIFCPGVGKICPNSNLPLALPSTPYIDQLRLIKMLTVSLQEYENKKGIKF